MFICDPVCVLPFGHNAPAMTYFRSFFEGQFDQIECCVGLPFDAAAAAERRFRRYFTYLYSDVMPLDSIGSGTEVGPPAGAWPHDAASRAAKTDYLTLIEREQLSAADVVFLPSADFHSIIGLMAALRDQPPEASPRILLRLIGVMEHANHVVVQPMKKLFAAIRAARDAGYRILLAAETPAYASHLDCNFDFDVAMLPYPLLGAALPLPESEPFVVASAGSARFDKGYLDLLSIIKEVRRHPDGADIAFRIQTLPDRDAVRQVGYTNQLYAMPGVELLPAVLEPDEMEGLYGGCHAVLLPYDRAVYQLRGSAVLMEAIAYGRYAIGRDGLGFSSQILYYRNGSVCATVEQFAAAILDAARRPIAALQRQLTLARSRYRDDTAAAYRTWMESCFA